MNLRSSFFAVALGVAGLTSGCGGSGGTPDMTVAAGPDMASIAETCAGYCGAIMNTCTGSLQQYPTMDSCMNACMTFPPGTAADTGGNTLGCRVYHTGAARNDPNTHCIHAGPSGGGVCGMSCEGFCAIAQVVCANVQPAPPFATAVDCGIACAGYPMTPPYNTTVTSGNSFACRMYHLTVASETGAANQTTHCPHIVTNSAVCK